MDTQFPMPCLTGTMRRAVALVRPESATVRVVPRLLKPVPEAYQGHLADVLAGLSLSDCHVDCHGEVHVSGLDAWTREHLAFDVHVTDFGYDGGECRVLSESYRHNLEAAEQGGEA